MFELTHPGPTGKSGRGYQVLGVDGPGDPDDNRYVECYQCGFPVLLGRDTQGPSFDSPGLVAVTTQEPVQAQFGGGTVPVIEMQVVGGCPFCGSLNSMGLNRLRETRARYPRTRR